MPIVCHLWTTTARQTGECGRPDTMGSRRMLGLFLLVVLAALCLQPCGSDDPDLSDNKADEGGIFGFTLSSPFLFWSDDEYEINDNVFVENTASQGKGDKDSTDDNHGDKSQVNDKEESGKEEEKKTDDEHGDAAASDLKELDDEDEDEVAQMDQFIDVDERFKGQRRLFKRSSDDKDAAGSRKMLRDATHNDSVALQDSFLCPQTPDMLQLSYYMDTCHNCLVQTDRHSCPLHEAALELKKQMTELQELLSYGCRMGCSSHDSRCCHNSDLTLLSAVQDMTKLTEQMYKIFLESCSSCPRDGGWSEWCEWGPCSVTCGEGTRTRSRKCNNPTVRGNGRPCQGPDRESAPCFSPSCCAWGSWGAWSDCAVTCGQGTVERRRSCVSPTDPFCSPSQCPGSSVERSQRQCGPDPGDGSWGAWQRWSSCSVTCGRGTRSRTRRCDSPLPNICGRGCSGESVEREECGEPCIPCEWTSWGSWSSCLVTCGDGVVERSRSCFSPFSRACLLSECGGPATETRRERCGPDPRDGVWGSWQPWSLCSVTCGTGTQQRMRLCDSPSPNVCGRECSGARMEQKVCFETCTTPPSCVWTSWGSWSRCLVTCGDGVVERSRSCFSPFSRACSPSECGGPATETRRERCGPDPRDGHWGSWDSWGPCSVTCGSGTQQRVPLCDNPSPNVCGRECSGARMEQQVCFLEECPPPPPPSCEWTPWGSWSRCLVTCGDGVVERSRSCLSPSLLDCSPSQCGGPATETRRERCGPDPVDGNWGQWGSWGACPVSCGSGLQQRSRRCDNPPPNGCGRGCPGSSVDVQSCREPCREWSSWEPWCSCECRKGTRARRRGCQERSSTGEVVLVDIRHCGFNQSREEEPCDVRLTCPECVLSCQGLTKLTYPSCTSCRDYFNCTNDRMDITSCKSGYEYDSFIGMCMPGESPSCTLRDCVTSCQDQSGRVPSCQAECSGYFDCSQDRGPQIFCPSDQEFNAHSRRCEAPPSPTCKRVTSDVMYGDAPDDNYFNIEDENAEEKYKELLKKSGVVATLGLDVNSLPLFKHEPVPKTDNKRNTTEEITGKIGKKKATKSSRMSEKDKETVQCQKDCSGLAPGLYQSCTGCDHYLVCTKHGITRLGRCPSNKVWDDKRKKCRKTSLTCKSSASNELDPGTS